MKLVFLFLGCLITVAVLLAVENDSQIFQKRDIRYQQLKELEFDQREMLDKQLFGKRVRDIAHNLRCPLCQGLSVKESNSSISIMMKTKIHELLEEGKSEEEILQYFVGRYGEWILRSPTKSGINLLLWLLPGVLILSAVSLLIVSKKGRAKPSPNLEPLTSNERQKIENDLKLFE